MKSLREIDVPTLLKAAEMFIRHESTINIRDVVNKELKRIGVDYKVSREQVYQMIDIARERKYFHLVPPKEEGLKQRIVDKFNVTPEAISVADTRTLEHVTSLAAQVSVDLIQKIGKRKQSGNEDDVDKRRVRVGLGGGWTSMLVASYLATGLRSLGEDLPPLAFHALSSGFDARRPRTAPVSFFGFFDGLGVDTEFFGLFAPPVVKTRRYNETISAKGVKESFDYKNDLDIVITSLGSATHPHGDFSAFMNLGPSDGLNKLKKAGWIGDVQYRPYSIDEPIKIDTGIRAVTLLDLDGMAKMARNEDKHVVVVAGPCRQCGKPRSDAVRPLFVSKQLRLWSRFVMDVDTASEILM